MRLIDETYEEMPEKVSHTYDHGIFTAYPRSYLKCRDIRFRIIYKPNEGKQRVFRINCYTYNDITFKQVCDVLNNMVMGIKNEIEIIPAKPDTIVPKE